jgi:hypothetical protein
LKGRVVADINWNLLQTPNFSALFTQGMKMGQDLRREGETRKALSALETNPQDQGALNALLMYDPEIAFRVREDQRKQAEFQRGENFRNALSDFGPPGLGNSGSAPSPSVSQVGLGATPGAPQLPGIVSGYGGGTFDIDGRQVTPPDRQSEAAGPAVQDGLPRPTNARDAAFLRMWKADPVKAMEIDSDMRDNALKRIKAAREAYGWAAQALGGVTDEASWQEARKGFATRIAGLGVDVPDTIPMNYPGPEGVRALLAKALSADEQLSALDRRDRLTHDIEDDEADNDRADRNTDSLIDDRNKRRGLTARGQDIASSDRRRGQDVTDKRVRETGGGRGRGRAARAVVTVKTPEEARALAPGTVFRTPDGRVKVR